MTRALRYIFLLTLVLLQSSFQAANAEDEFPLYQEGSGAPVQARAGQLDYSRLWYFGAGIHRFEDNHLHPGRQAVVKQDIGLVNTLIEKGVPQDHIVELLDEDATSKNCRAGLENLLSRTKPGDTLLFFLHSHGSLQEGGIVATYETGGRWAFKDLIDQIERDFQGTQVCICVGACHSGSLLEVIRSQPRRQAYYAVTSVHPDVSALTIATADFEACIRDCFKGAPCPDLNSDGLITFDEMGRYICNDQLLLFGTKPDFGASERFDPQTVITAAEARKGDLDCRLVEVREGWKGRIVAQDGNELLVRGSKNPNLLSRVRRGAVKVIRPRY